MPDQQEMDKRFSYHAPDAVRQGLHTGWRSEVRALAEYLGEIGSESREKALALTALEEALMWGNAHIARNVNQDG